LGGVLSASNEGKGWKKKQNRSEAGPKKEGKNILGKKKKEVGQSRGIISALCANSSPEQVPRTRIGEWKEQRLKVPMKMRE